MFLFLLPFLPFLLVLSCLSIFFFPPTSHSHPFLSLSPHLTLSLLRQAFLSQLVCNLLDEGNTAFREGDWRQAAAQYSEGVNVARYAQAEALLIPAALLESLYVNRAAAYYSLVGSQFGTSLISR